jgi:hypothetical protein
VQVRYSEDLANHTDPESCAGAREGTGEALTRARAGEVLSGESDTKFGVPMPSSQAEGSRLGSVIARTLATLRRH